MNGFPPSRESQVTFSNYREHPFSQWSSEMPERPGANHGILVTEVMPKDMPTFGLRNGVWICTFKEVDGIAVAIRQICIIQANIKATEFNRAEKIQALYNYPD